MGSQCSYCESDIYDHNPVFVDEERDGTRETVSQFCNYACLSQHIENEQLGTNTCCQVDYQ
jgi:hypothetical protein